MDVSERCDKACLILKKTNDGNDLSPGELCLLENAVNGNLTDKGVQAFNDLHERVSNGTYKTPWFHGVEHMTYDHEGYVRYKGIDVEHFGTKWAWSDEAKEYVKSLADRAARYEKLNIKITSNTMVWSYETVDKLIEDKDTEGLAKYLNTTKDAA